AAQSVAREYGFKAGVEYSGPMVVVDERLGDFERQTVISRLVDGIRPLGDMQADEGDTSPWDMPGTEAHNAIQAVRDIRYLCEQAGIDIGAVGTDGTLVVHHP